VNPPTIIRELFILLDDPRFAEYEYLIIIRHRKTANTILKNLSARKELNAVIKEQDIRLKIN